MVVFIHRPEYYKITEDTQGNSLIGIAEIIVAKHRNGKTDDIRLKFKGIYAKFMNLDDENSDDDNASFSAYHTISSKMNDSHSFSNMGQSRSDEPPF